MMPVALLLSVISGHTLSAVFGQTDIGLYTFLALATVTAMFYNRHVLTVVLAFICGLTRPEGFIFAVAFLLTGGTTILLNRKYTEAPGEPRQGRYFLMAGTAAAIAFAITLCINKLLTGHFQFMSVVNKGYFKFYPFFGALELTLKDVGMMLKGIFFGLSITSRQYFIFPILGGLLSLCGILLHPKRDKRFQLCEIWLALCLGAIIVTVASSQWQGISNDRYLGWIMPLWLMYMLIGIDNLSERVQTKRFKPVLIGLLCAYQPVSTAYFLNYAYTSASYLDISKAFYSQIAESIPKEEQIGSIVGGRQYFLPEYRTYNLYGITSPAFSLPHFDSQLIRIVDLLKHKPELRFDNWLMLDSDYEKEKWAHPFIGALKLQDNDSAVTTLKIMCIYEAQWDTLEGGDRPVLVEPNLVDRALVDSMDIGYQADETAHDYLSSLRFKNTRLPLILKTAMLDKKSYSDLGRIVMGSEQFTVRQVQPGKPLFIALRTAKKVEGRSFFGQQSAIINNLEMNDVMELRLFIDGEEVECPPLDIGNEGFSEVLMEIPGKFVQTENPRIKVVGDHIAFAYWFYQ